MEPVVRRLSVGAVHHPVSVISLLTNRSEESRGLGRVGVSSSPYKCGLLQKVKDRWVLCRIRWSVNHAKGVHMREKVPAVKLFRHPTPP
jgi:hypothetical protein